MSCFGDFNELDLVKASSLLRAYLYHSFWRIGIKIYNYNKTNKQKKLIRNTGRKEKGTKRNKNILHYKNPAVAEEFLAPGVASWILMLSSRVYLLIDSGTNKP